MKAILYFFVIFSVVVGCATHKPHLKFSEKAMEPENDSTEYELVVFDLGFESWYALQNSPAKYRTKEYYENWNRQYVLAWNNKAMVSGNKGFFETIVGYDYNTDYGFELNHKLFHYFMFVENVLKIPVLESGPRFTS